MIQFKMLSTGGAAPINSQYYVASADGTLSAEVVVTGLATLNGIAKANGSGVFSAATAGVDYAAALGADDNYVTDAQLAALHADEPAASTTVVGVVELDTTAEIDTGTDSTRAMPVDQFVASNRNVRYILFRVLDKATDWSADATAAVGGDLVIPFTGTIVDIEADSDTAGTTGTAIVDVNLNGSTIMSTNKLKWDSTEKSTRTYSGTAPGLTTTAVTAGAIITLDIDTNHTTKSKGLTLFLAIRLT
jgi:hypothetical protein